MRPNTYNPDCDFDPDQRDLDASIEERNKTEPDATERARAWVQKQTGRFELDNPLLEADIADLAAFLESETSRIKADAVREFIEEVEKEIIEHLEAENALLKKKLKIAMAGLDEYADGHRWSSRTGKVSQGLVYDVFFPDCGGNHGYELARKIKALIEEVK